MTDVDGQTQLLRYAQDLQRLMQQHDRLQKQHQMLLQSIGREVQTQDLLLNLLAASTPLYVVTDADGEVLRVSEEAKRNIEYTTGRLKGHALARCVHPEEASVIEGVIGKFSDDAGASLGVQMQLRIVHCAPQSHALRFDALVIQQDGGGRHEIYWFLRPVPATPQSDWKIQDAFLRSVRSDKGLLLTDPYGNIQSVNSEFCRISGYSEEELLGQNPRLLSSGRHDSAFYQDLWAELLDKGSWSGTLFNRRKSGQIYLQWQCIKLMENPRGDVISYLSAVADLSQNEGITQQMRKLANHDPLTALPNRRLLSETLAQSLADACRQDTELAVLYLDLDHFKPVNDELGHTVGDLVLQQVALRLRAAIAPTDLLARVGGDEFVVVLSSDRTDQAQSIAQDLCQVIRAPIHAGPHSLVVGASIGCARYPRDGSDMVALLKHADVAMLYAKRLSLPFAFYDVSKDLRVQPHIEHEVWQAQERGELHLQFQPQLCSSGTGSIRGCEVLIRWQHPTLGDVPASAFVPIAERNGAIVPIGKWVLAQACAQLSTWRALGLANLSVSVNVSLRQLREADFEFHVRQVLADNAIPPRFLELEFSETETLLFNDNDIKHISALSAFGVRISIDDFGISFASLTRLHSLAISSLKINSQFVRDLVSSNDARLISNCMLAIGRALGIDVIAQGVESADQARILSEQGCQLMQGHFSGHPMAADALLHLAQRHEYL